MNKDALLLTLVVLLVIVALSTAGIPTAKKLSGLLETSAAKAVKR